MTFEEIKKCIGSKSDMCILYLQVRTKNEKDTFLKEILNFIHIHEVIYKLF